VLRIEDTDVERSRPEWTDTILAGLTWLGMEPDEGPYRQSERGQRYGEAIEQLWSGGYLYACDCIRDDVLARTRDNPTPGYDGHCRDRDLARSQRTALRFRTPEVGTTVVHDVIRGDVEFPHEAIEDFVCVKSSGQPLFVLANAIDDRDNAISHVIRGEDLLPSTPKGLLLWGALDTWEPVELPVFAHLPMLVNEQRKKLSKRRDPVAVESYRDQGYLAVAFRNYLALLGWSPPGDREKVDVETLIAEFKLEDVHHGPAFFDVKKLTHLNGEYIRELTTAEFEVAVKPWVDPDPDGSSWSPAGHRVPWPPERFDEERFAEIAPLVKERVAVLGETPSMVDFLFLDEPTIDEGSWAKVARDPASRQILAETIDAYATCEWDRDTLYAVTEAVAQSVGTKLRKVDTPIRVAVTGRSVGPPLFEPLEILGRDVVLARLRRGLDRLNTG
jgi:glutamyl-tRNA synthetase